MGKKRWCDSQTVCLNVFIHQPHFHRLNTFGMPPAGKCTWMSSPLKGSLRCRIGVQVQSCFVKGRGCWVTHGKNPIRMFGKSQSEMANLRSFSWFDGESLGTWCRWVACPQKTAVYHFHCIRSGYQCWSRNFRKACVCECVSALGTYVAKDLRSCSSA